LGLRGVMLHPWEELCAINSAPLDPLLTYAAEHALPLLIEGGHPRVSEASQIGELARRFPEVTMIVTHAGQSNISGRGLFDAARLTFDIGGECIPFVYDPPNARKRLTLLSEATFGPNVGMPRIMRLLSEYNLPATFFIPGFTAERHPDILQDLVRQGHEIGH